MVNIVKSDILIVDIVKDLKDISKERYKQKKLMKERFSRILENQRFP